MSYVNKQILLLQVKFSRYYSSRIGCMSSVKTRLAFVGVNQIYSPYSGQLICHSLVIVRISRLLKKK